MKFTRSIILICILVLTVVDLSAQVKCGVDNLIDTDFALLRGKKVVLVTHAAARTYRGTSTAEEFLQRTDIATLRLLAPEHGYFGVIAAGKNVADDTVMGVPVISLYGPKRRPGELATMANAESWLSKDSLGTARQMLSHRSAM
ncbi:MAG: DUF1343 domain-containing protein [Ignavibacteria bacterium]|nr:DUF1343 domain-containing protein [Ignavibacteria bacterium]